jgi:chemotaxis protein methyltransferase CheR
VYPDPENMDMIILHLQREGLSVSDAVSSLVYSLHLRMKEKKSTTYKEYFSCLKEAEELEFFREKLSINVTSFFRDPTVFDSLLVFLRIYIDEIINRSEKSKLKIWSAGCANGSEPYSIAILLHEALKHHHSRYTIKIHATDINKDVLEIAKAGNYPNSIVNEVPTILLNQYFSQSVSNYHVSNKIKKYINFSHLDLLSDSLPFKNFDMISCRYVLMYLTKAQQIQLLKKFHELLLPGGLLLLGITDPMPLSEQNLFSPLLDQTIYLSLSIEDRIYQKPLSQEQREKIIASLPEEEYTCEWCGRVFVSEKKLRIHLKHDSCRHRTPICYLCNKHHFSRTGLTAHLKYAHYIDRTDRISNVFNKNRNKIYEST